MAYENGYKESYERARVEAYEEALGKAEECQGTAKKMLKKGLPLETIRDITDISIDELKELQEEGK
jgi:predicted transposase/invertase (TIGR01784 family)